MAAKRSEGMKRRPGALSTVLLFEDCTEGVESLFRSGYKVVDTMTVMSSEGIAAERESHARIRMARSAQDWAAAYLLAFYGNEDLIRIVRPIVGRLLRTKEATLFEAKVGRKTAGVMAVFRTEGLAGVYCLGTVPEYRGSGVASGFLSSARELADSEGRKLVLQTLASDGAYAFYHRRGFAKLYAKLMMQKES
jgi:GNAT superfamily N-acetyltransferase